MNLLEIFFIISGVIIFILALDVARKQRFNALHFVVFIGIGAGLLVFSFFPEVLSYIGRLFGLQRGADVLIYTSIIFLLYFVLLLLSKVEDNKDSIISLVRELAINDSPKKILSGKYVFIIPAYNEGKIIKDTINSILSRGYKNILVINDGSKDDTLSKLKSFGEKVTILNHYKNYGQGSSLETGFEYIRRYGKVDYVITFDSDGQHDIADISSFEKVLEKEKDLDILFGSRFLRKDSIASIPIFRRIVLKLGILFTYILSNVKLSDTHNGYRIIKRQALDKIKITLGGMGHASEIIDQVITNNLKYKEVPVHIKYTEYSLSKGQKSSNAINIALKMIWSKFFK